MAAVLLIAGYFLYPTSSQDMQQEPLFGVSGSLSFLQGAVSTANQTTYTFSSQNLGTAASDRYIIAAISTTGIADAQINVSSVTIGGVSATQVVTNNFNSVSSGLVALYIAAVPTGTTGNVVVTFDAGCARAGIALYRVTGLGSATASATGQDEDNEGSANPSESTGINVPADGFAIGASFTQNQQSATAAWTGVTEQYEATVEGNAKHTGGYVETDSALTPLTVTVSWTTTETGAGMVAASWAYASAATTPVKVPDIIQFN